MRRFYSEISSNSAFVTVEARAVEGDSSAGRIPASTSAPTSTPTSTRPRWVWCEQPCRQLALREVDSACSHRRYRAFLPCRFLLNSSQDTLIQCHPTSTIEQQDQLQQLHPHHCIDAATHTTPAAATATTARIRTVCLFTTINLWTCRNLLVRSNQIASLAIGARKRPSPMHEGRTLLKRLCRVSFGLIITAMDKSSVVAKAAEAIFDVCSSNEYPDIQPACAMQAAMR